MKIAFVIYNLKKGGAERVVSLLSKELSKKHEISIIVFNNSIEYEYGGELIYLNCDSIKNKIGKIFNIIRRTYKLRRLFKKEMYDKIYCFMETAYLPAILTGFPIIASVRNNPHKHSKYITKYILANAKKIITVSKEIENILIKEFNISNIMTINNPIDFTLIDKLKNDSIDEKSKFIMAVGRLHHQKGFDILIDAYSKSNVKNKAKLLIFGDGKLKNDLQKLIDKNDLSNSIILKGIVDNLYKYLYRAEMFILSSRYEGFPNVLIEALACCTPSISTDCPTGPKEIIKNNFNGLLVKNENTDELSNAIDKLYFDESLKEKFRKKARSSIQHLNIKNIANKWLGQ